MIYITGNYFVEDHNKAALSLMNKYNISVVNLYQRVTDYCGNQYINCDICQTKPCGFHYTPTGYQYISEWVSGNISLYI